MAPNKKTRAWWQHALVFLSLPVGLFVQIFLDYGLDIDFECPILIGVAAETPGGLYHAVSAQVEADLSIRQSTIPAAYQNAAWAGNGATGLEETLTRLYRRANPSVVYIIVSSTSSGSGFVYDRDGHIITNHHVVSGGRSYEVVFAGGERRRARLIGSDADRALHISVHWGQL